MTTAWVMPGGASLGAIQVGQAEVIMAAGHMPDILIGTSAGSLNAAWLAGNPTLDGLAGLRDLWLNVKRREIFPWRPVPIGLGLLGRRDHIVEPTNFLHWLEGVAPFERIEQAAVPLTITSTDLVTGEPVYQRRGLTIPALAASCAVPGVFPPVWIDGHQLVDGGMSADAPVGLAVEAGADTVFVFPTLGSIPEQMPRSAGGVLGRSVALMFGAARRAEMASWADRAEIYVAPSPDTTGMSPFSFKRGARLIEEARALAAAWLPGARPLEAAVTDYAVEADTRS